MKTAKQLFLGSMMIASAIIVNAQNKTTFSTTEVKRLMSKGEQTGIEISFDGTKPENAKEAFIKLTKKNKAKSAAPVTKGSPEIFVDDIQLSNISATPVDLYAMILPTETGSKLVLYTDMGGYFLSSGNPEPFSSMEVLLRKFAQDRAIEVAEDRVKAEEKGLKSLEKEAEELKKAKANYVKEIEKCRAIIAQREQDIIRNDGEQKNKGEQIGTQKSILQKAVDHRGSLNY